MVKTLDGRYELSSVLGTGGMAQVFEGYDRRLGRRVAIKLVAGDVPDPGVRERFQREARAAAAFSHPNAVTVYDAGEDGLRPYIVMELVDGPSLADVLAERGPLRPEEAVHIADQVLAALGAAHARGLVHRDVKPANVLLTPAGDAKLADFGIAKSLEDAAAALTGSGQLLGTPRYLSPEQVAGKPATPRSDLYSLGVLIYEMLAGHPPFQADTAMAVALAHQRDPVPPLAGVQPGLPAGLVSAVERALEKDPADRHADAAAMQAALRTGGVDIVGATQAMASDTQVLDVAPEATHVEPAAGVTPRRGVPQRRGGWLVAAGLALVVLVLLALAAAGGDDPNERTAAPSTTVLPSTTAPRPAATRTPTTESFTTAPPETVPRSTVARSSPLDQLFQALAVNPEAYGEKGPNLVRRLRDVLRAEDPEERAEETEDAIEDIHKWMEDGELDPAVGNAALSLLQSGA